MIEGFSFKKRGKIKKVKSLCSHTVNIFVRMMSEDWCQLVVAALAVLLFSFLFYLYVRNPLSMQTKLFMLIGYVPKYLKDLEWQFIAAEVGKKQKRIIVAFAGGGVRIGGYTLGEFASTCSRVPNCDALLLSDTLQLWYLADYDRLHARLKSFLHGYDEVLMLGNCLGGTGALIYADLATSVLTFGPQTSLVRARLGGIYWLNSWRLPSGVRESIESILEEKTKKCAGTCYAYFSPCKDTYMAGYTPSSVITEIVHDCGNGNVPMWLKKRSAITGNDEMVLFIEKHFKK